MGRLPLVCLPFIASSLSGTLAIHTPSRLPRTSSCFYKVPILWFSSARVMEAHALSHNVAHRLRCATTGGLVGALNASPQLRWMQHMSDRVLSVIEGCWYTGSTVMGWCMLFTLEMGRPSLTATTGSAVIASSPRGMLAATFTCAYVCF